MTDTFRLWSYLAEAPLLWLTLTLLAYVLGERIFKAVGGKSWANPVLIAMVLVGALLVLTETDYETYFEGAQFVHFMLGPATVALALPIYENRARISRALLPIAAALFAGSVVAIVSVLLIAKGFGLPDVLLASLAPKSSTAPVALSISESLGGMPTLTAALVQGTGITGAMIALPLFAFLRINEDRSRGLALGIASHGIGTARAFQASARMGAFAGIGMALNAILTAILAPVILRLMQ